MELLDDKFAKEKLKKIKKVSMTRSMSEVIKLKQEQLEPNYKKNLYQKNEIIDNLKIKIRYWENLSQETKKQMFSSTGLERKNLSLKFAKIINNLNDLKELKKILDNVVNSSLNIADSFSDE